MLSKMVSPCKSSPHVYPHVHFLFHLLLSDVVYIHYLVIELIVFFPSPEYEIHEDMDFIFFKFYPLPYF